MGSQRVRRDWATTTAPVGQVLYVHNYNHLYFTSPHFQHVISVPDSTGSSLPPKHKYYLLPPPSFLGSFCPSRSHPSLKAQCQPHLAPKYFSPPPSTCIFHFSGLLLFSCVSPHIPTQFTRAEYLQVNLWFCSSAKPCPKQKPKIHYCMNSQGSIMGITSLRWYLLYLYYVKSLKPWWYVFSVFKYPPLSTTVGRKGSRGAVWGSAEHPGQWR